MTTRGAANRGLSETHISTHGAAEDAKRLRLEPLGSLWQDQITIRE